MTSFLAVVFFCAGDCYFWSSKKLHNSETACQREIALVIKELEKQQVEGKWQCIRVPLTEA